MEVFEALYWRKVVFGPRVLLQRCHGKRLATATGMVKGYGSPNIREDAVVLADKKVSPTALDFRSRSNINDFDLCEFPRGILHPLLE